MKGGVITVPNSAKAQHACLSYRDARCVTPGRGGLTDEKLAE